MCVWRESSANETTQAANADWQSAAQTLTISAEDAASVLGYPADWRIRLTFSIEEAAAPSISKRMTSQKLGQAYVPQQSGIV